MGKPLHLIDGHAGGVKVIKKTLLLFYKHSSYSLTSSRKTFPMTQPELADCPVCSHSTSLTPACLLLAVPVLPPSLSLLASELLGGRICTLVIFVAPADCLACTRCSVSVCSMNVCSQSFGLILKKYSLCSLCPPVLTLQPLTWPSKISPFIQPLGGSICTYLESGGSRFNFWLHTYQLCDLRQVLNLSELQVPHL